jgi:ABC-2 type transport system permease protein
VRLVLVHAVAVTRELGRYPAYVLPTLLFPTAFFLFFVVPDAGRFATVETAAFAAFAAIGVAFFQFGVGIANERASPWEAYLRTLPVAVPQRLAARVLSAAVFATAAAGLLLLVGVSTTDVSLSRVRWIELAVVLLLGTIPFALLGIALGYWAPARGALPIANLLYLSLAYAGGLWIRPDELPDPVQAVSPFLPTRALTDAITATVYADPFEPRPWLILLGFAAGFALLAGWGFLRDEGKRFR